MMKRMDDTEEKVTNVKKSSGGQKIADARETPEFKKADLPVTR
jgi:hypothetical protein